MSLFIEKYKEILNNLEANSTALTGTKLNKRSSLYGIMNGLAKEQTLQRLYNENKLYKKILIERQNPEEAKETGNIIGLQQNPATSANGYALIQGTIGKTIESSIEFTTGINTYKVLQASTISLNEQILFSLSRIGTIAIAKTYSSHNLGSGTILSISGANEDNFNQNNILITVISNDEFTYVVEDIGETKATGTIKYSANYALLNLLCNQTGENTNLSNGDIINMTTTIDNVNSFCIINYNGITGGIEEESLNNYKDRLQNKFANNTNDYASILIENTLQTKFPIIAEALLVKNFIFPIKITSIRKLTDNEKLIYTDFDNDRFRVVETQLPHNINRICFPITISGSLNSLNIPTGQVPYSITYYILDIDKIIIYVGNINDEDLTCSNVFLNPYSTNSCLFILKKGTDKYPTTQEISEYYNFIEEEVLPFTDSGYYFIAPFEKLTIDFEVFNILPNNEGLKNSIKTNLYDYFNNYVKGGQSISKSKYENIIYQSKSGIYEVTNFDVICKVNNVITTNIEPKKYEYPHINNVIIN